ncbi:hypothetical protein [Maridesulfovibrio sp.]|uniref:hypothetical protein n=1 Tax=Maridesulfovibrio sp. TaxID=2795000 RepID=UPI002A18DA2C|nr:hypothetical protein [Maridesulfovibrio sp.]
MKNIIFLCLTLFLVTGCGPQYRCEIDSFSKVFNVAGKTFVVVPGNKNVTPNDFQFNEFATYVVRAMQSKGLRYAQRYETADLIILLGYGISGPKTSTSTVSVPVWGQTGVSSSHTYGTINTYGNQGTYSGTTTYTPTYGITGYTQQTRTHTDYTRFFWIDAYDYKEFLQTKKEIQIWKTTVTSTGSTNDLRQVFPIMLAGSLEHIGTNTGHKVEVTLGMNDKKVLYVKGIKNE